MNARIDERLRALAESDYKAFSERIIPTEYPIQGVRAPVLKKLAQELAGHPDIEIWLDNAEFPTYEHVLLYGLVLSKLKNLTLDRLFGYLDPLIEKFDNWAHVDMLISAYKLFAKHQEAVLTHFLPLKTHAGEFTKRVFVIVLMDFFMDEAHIESTLLHLSQVPQGQYYTDMAIAWALSVGLVRFYEQTVPWLERRRFSTWVHNKTIQKARESYRIPPEAKEYLNSLKIR